MAQTSRPVADFAAPTNFYAGSATFPGPPAPNVADLYETVDEAVASDADGIVLESSGGTAWFTMDALSAPSDLYLYVRSGGHNSSGVVTTASLYEPDGTTLIDSQMFVPFHDGSLSEKSVEFDISGGISDPSALVVKLEQGSTLGSGGYVYTTQLYLYDSGGTPPSGGFDVSIDDILRGKGDLKDKRIQVGADRRYQFNIKESFGSQTDKVMKWAEPESEEDALNGRVCSFSGHWFPSRLIVYIGGRPYGEPFAPFPNATQGYGLDPEVPGEQ